MNTKQLLFDSDVIRVRSSKYIEGGRGFAALKEYEPLHRRMLGDHAWVHRLSMIMYKSGSKGDAGRGRPGITDLRIYYHNGTHPRSPSEGCNDDRRRL